MGLYRYMYVKNSNSGFCILYSSFLSLKVKQNRFFTQLSGTKSLLNILSLVRNVLLFLLFSRLNMDRLSFVFSLLLIFSVTTATFGSVIKAKNPYAEVNKESRLFSVLFYCLWSHILPAVLDGVSPEISMAFLEIR